MVGFEVVFFPIYGLTVGINYWNSKMDEWPDWVDTQEDEEQHMIQIFLFFFGTSFIWYR